MRALVKHGFVFVAWFLLVANADFRRGWAAELSPAEIEAQFVKQLAAGRQAAAEAFLAKQLARHPKNQRLLFLDACCERSRFDIRAALPKFIEVAKMNQQSVSGQCANLLANLDQGLDTHLKFMALRTLVEKHPEDLVLRWMIAVQCRSLHKNEEGVQHYQILLKAWKPGPALVHQTYGNVLDELQRFEEALVERRQTVELEPAGWSYQGLGNTLTALKRFDEANEAFQKSVALGPQDASYWRSYAWSLMKQSRFSESIAMCEKAIALDPAESLAWAHWGECLQRQGEFSEALAKYKQALEIDPTDTIVKSRVETIETWLKSKSGPPRSFSPR